jgi:hypothetical protein
MEVIACLVVSTSNASSACDNFSFHKVLILQCLLFKISIVNFAKKANQCEIILCCVIIKRVTKIKFLSFWLFL